VRDYRKLLPFKDFRAGPQPRRPRARGALPPQPVKPPRSCDRWPCYLSRRPGPDQRRPAHPPTEPRGEPGYMMTNRQANELRSYQELGIGRAVTVESPERGGSRRPAETQRVFTLKAASIRSPSSEMRPANVQGGVSPEPPNLSLSVPQCPIRRGHPIGGAAERAAVDTVPARNRPRSGANRPVSGPKSVSRVSRFRRATLLEPPFFADFAGIPPRPPAQPLYRPVRSIQRHTRRRACSVKRPSPESWTQTRLA